MKNGGKKHACGYAMESAPSFLEYKGKGKGGKGKKGPPPPDSSAAAFKAHNDAQKAKRDTFKRKMEETRVFRLNEADALAAQNKNQKA